MSWLNDYTKEIAGIAAGGDDTELSYRTPIENLLGAAAKAFGNNITVLQEPSRLKNIGAPDFRLTAPGGGIVGYVECKPPGENLHKLISGAQLQKYRALSSNILLTDCWQWLQLREGKMVQQLTLSEKPDSKQQQAFADLLRAFIDAEPEQIGDANRLAEALARRCAMLRDGIATHATDNPAQSRLHGLVQAFQVTLDTDLRFDQFADTFAQTLVYSLLLARLKAAAGAALNLYNINQHIPTNFALIREITIFVQDLRNSQYDNIAWVVDDILAIVNTMDAAAVTETLSYRNGGRGFGDTDDPYIYFYENFLAAYDAKQREVRGIYYTPPPVVKFIVRAVNDLLCRDFNLPDGLAQSDTVTALDFAAGTGTFMLEMLRSVFNDTTPAKRKLLASGHILKHFYGFELLMAPYAIAHLKLSQFLADHDAPLQDGERINIFLTNTLEQISKQVELPMLPKLAEEANRAQSIKNSPVLVIVGNPPYSVASQNKGDWIVKLINDYKFVDGKPLKERKQVLTDDYVKFIRFAQWKMQQVERGIVAIITNHGFLDNPTFRGMRQSLLNTFDTLYFLDLHGNANKKETAPDGGKDDNVFDIRQGVAISILVKNPQAKTKGVYRADFYGRRESKYRACLEGDITTLPWQRLKPVSPFFLFVRRDNRAAKSYERLPSIADIFSLSSVGVMTRRDDVAICFDAATVEKTVQDFQTMNESDLRSRYNIAQDSVNWKVDNVRKDLKENQGFVCPIAYRPFDTRFTYYTGQTNGFHSRPLVKTMRPMLAGDNIGLSVSRSATGQETWQDVFVVNKIAEFGIMSTRPGNSAPIFPLYRYEEEMGKTVKRENLTEPFRNWIDDRYGKKHPPETLLGAIYAILHSPDYRKRYVDFLRTDFPRLPFPQQNAEFERLATIGNQLIAAHLLRAHYAGDLAQHHGPANATHRVDLVRYNEKTSRLYFNKDEYFAPVPPEVFNFPIGGYQPLDKYLKSRKGRTLTLADTETLRKAANVIAFTIEKISDL